MYDIRNKKTTNPQEIQFAELEETYGCVLRNNAEEGMIEIGNEDGSESIPVAYEDADNLIKALIEARDEFNFWHNSNTR